MNRNEIAYRTQEEAFIARKFNMYELYPPSKRFTRAATPQFGRRSDGMVIPATPSILDLYRDPGRRHSPRLRDGYAAIIVDLRATDDKLARGVLDVARALRKPLPGFDVSKVFAGAHRMASLKADMALPRERAKRRSTKLESMETYLKVWDLNRKLKKGQPDRYQRLKHIAQELISKADGDEDKAYRATELVDEYLSKANKYIRQAAAGEFLS